MSNEMKLVVHANLPLGEVQLPHQGLALQRPLHQPGEETDVSAMMDLQETLQILLWPLAVAAVEVLLFYRLHLPVSRLTRPLMNVDGAVEPGVKIAIRQETVIETESIIARETEIENVIVTVNASVIPGIGIVPEIGIGTGIDVRRAPMRLSRVVDLAVIVVEVVVPEVLGLESVAGRQCIPTRAMNNLPLAVEDR